MGIFEALKEMNDEPNFKKVDNGLFESMVEDVEIKEGVFETEIKISYIIVTPGKSEGGKITQWFKIKEDDSANDKKMRFIQWQVKAITGLETLKDADLLQALANSRGNLVEIEVSTHEYNGKNYQGVTVKNFVKGN